MSDLELHHRIAESLHDLPPRERVFALEEALKGLDNQLSLPDFTSHYIANGVYVRSLFLPAGTCATGYIHLLDHVVILIGDVSVYDETGAKHLTGVNIFTSKAGVKRAAYAHSDTHFVTAHRMSDPNETDIAALEKEFVCSTYKEFDEIMLIRQQGALPCPSRL